MRLRLAYEQWTFISTAAVVQMCRVRVFINYVHLVAQEAFFVRFFLPFHLCAINIIIIILFYALTVPSRGDGNNDDDNDDDDGGNGGGEQRVHTS